jgi:hypothetical protein
LAEKIPLGDCTLTLYDAKTGEVILEGVSVTGVIITKDTPISGNMGVFAPRLTTEASDSARLGNMKEEP